MLLLQLATIRTSLPQDDAMPGELPPDCDGADAVDVYFDFERRIKNVFVTTEGSVLAAGNLLAGPETILRSVDGGETWVESPAVGAGFAQGRPSLFGADRGGAIYWYGAAALPDGLDCPEEPHEFGLMKRSVDDGRTWETVHEFCEARQRTIKSIEQITRFGPAGEVWMAGKRVDDGVPYAALGRSVDGGESWDIVVAIPMESSIGVVVVGSGAVVWLTERPLERDGAGNRIGFPFVARTSRDGGATWTLSELGHYSSHYSSGIPQKLLAARPGGGAYVLAKEFDSDSNGSGVTGDWSLWRSEDGLDWERRGTFPRWLSRNADRDTLVHDVAIDAAGRLFVAGPHWFVAQSHDEGGSWCFLEHQVLGRAVRAVRIAADSRGFVYSSSESLRVNEFGFERLTRSLIRRASVRADGAFPFRRGDVNDDGSRNLSDAVAALQHLFLGGPAPACEDSADVDDDGTLQLSDAVFLLSFLFRAGPAIPAPAGPGCGPDPTDDDLPCASASCE